MQKTSGSTKWGFNFWIIVAILLGIGFGSLGTWFTVSRYIGVPASAELVYHKKVTNQPIITKPITDPTIAWTSFSSPAGQFSLRYPSAWKKLTCGDSPGTLYIASTDAALAHCNSGFGGQMYVSSVAGDQRSSYESSLTYPDKTETAVTVAGVSGKRQTATVSATASPGPDVGTKLVQYVFFTGVRTYVCYYQQAPSGPIATDVLSDFDLMVKNTLTFK